MVVPGWGLRAECGGGCTRLGSESGRWGWLYLAGAHGPTVHHVLAHVAEQLLGTREVRLLAAHHEGEARVSGSQNACNHCKF